MFSNAPSCGPGRWLCRCDRVQRADRSPSPVSSPFVTKCSSLVASDLDTQLAAANGVAAALWSACDRSPLPAAVTAGPTGASVPSEGREKLGTTDELSPPAETPVPRPAPPERQLARSAPRGPVAAAVSAGRGRHTVTPQCPRSKTRSAPLGTGWPLEFKAMKTQMRRWRMRRKRSQGAERSVLASDSLENARTHVAGFGVCGGPANRPHAASPPPANGTREGRGKHKALASSEA